MCFQPVTQGHPGTARELLFLPPFSFNSSATLEPLTRRTCVSTAGVPCRGNGSAGLRQTQVARQLHVPRSLDLAELRGLGHLTVLSAQAGRDNGIFHRLPVCSVRKQLMPHLEMVPGGKHANSPSWHLTRLLLAHSAGSLKG